MFLSHLEMKVLTLVGNNNMKKIFFISLFLPLMFLSQITGGLNKSFQTSSKDLNYDKKENKKEERKQKRAHYLRAEMYVPLGQRWEIIQAPRSVGGWDL